MDVSKFEELIERLEKHKADQSRRLEAKHADIATKRALRLHPSPTSTLTQRPDTPLLPCSTPMPCRR